MSLFENNYSNNPTFETIVKCPLTEKDIKHNINAWINNDPLLITKFMDYDQLSLENASFNEKLKDWDDSQYDKKSIFYQLQYNLTCKDSDIDTLDNAWYTVYKHNTNGADNYTKYYLPQYGDYITKCRLILSKTNDINEFYNSFIHFDCDGQEMFSGTIKFIIAMNEFLGEDKIREEDDCYIIPLCIFKLIGFKVMNMIRSPHATVFFDIWGNYSDCAMQIMYGFYGTDLRRTVAQTRDRCLTMNIRSGRIKFDDYITEFHTQLRYLNQGFVIWYHNCDIAPTILKLEIKMKYCDQYYNKEIQLSEIKKLKCGNQNGFFVSTNRFNFDQFVMFLKSLNPKTDLTIFNEFIWWTDIETTLSIHWTNYYNDSFIVIDSCYLTTMNHNNMFYHKFSN